MNKIELVEAMSAKADISKAAANRALEALMETITESLAKGDSVYLIGFGNFSVSERAARTGRNPSTGESMQIAASKQPKFSAGAKLKSALNK